MKEANLSQKQSRRRARQSGVVTAKQVAEVAGVSVATVSRVLNKNGRVGSKTRARVSDIANDLGYVPHGAARALASDRTWMIGVVIPTLENPTFAKAVEAMQFRFLEAGYTLTIGSSHYNEETEARQVRAMVAKGVDGIVLVGHQGSEMVNFLRAKEVVYEGTWILDPEIPCVGFDNMAIARQLTDYLLDLGHKNIGIIAGITRNNDRAAGRVRGVRVALEARGLSLHQERLLERPYRIVEGKYALRAMVQGNDPPTAIICGNDLLAFGALIECARLGIRVPDDISIAGIDDMEFASCIQPSLTTMRVPGDEIGLRAAEYLIDVLAGNSVAQMNEIPVNLIVRASTGPPRKGVKW